MEQSREPWGEERRTIRCCGCGCECEVVVELRQGEEARVLGGNNCPTGESFALAQCTQSAEE